MMKDVDSVKLDLPAQSPLDEENDTDTPWFPATHQLLPAQAKVASDWIAQRRQGLRGWREFARTDKFQLPRGPSIAGRRIVRNVEYFQSNYLCVFAVLTLYCILTSPLLLVALAACFGLLYLIKVKNAQHGGRLIVAGRDVSPAYQYGIVALLSFPLFYMAGAGSIIFWVIGASIFVIVVHALLYASEEIPGADFETETV